MPEITPIQSRSSTATIHLTPNGDKSSDVAEKHLDADPYLVRFSDDDPHNPKVCQFFPVVSALL